MRVQNYLLEVSHNSTIGLKRKNWLLNRPNKQSNFFNQKILKTIRSEQSESR